MNRRLTLAMAVALAALLQGCAYDPYTGMFVPLNDGGYGAACHYGAYGYLGYGYPVPRGYPAYECPPYGSWAY